MLFIAIHTHTPESCPLVDVQPILQLADEEHIKRTGVRVLGSYSAPPEHTLFFVLEADDYSQIVRYFQPMMMIGTPRIIPVQTIAESAEALGTS
jgi:hypothetical protein